MSADVRELTPGAGIRAGRLRRGGGMPGEALVLIEREAFTVVLVAGLTAVLASALGSMLAPDSWLSLVVGREIVHAGIPEANTLTAWGRDTRWIDQQWLGHVILHQLERAGGLRALVVTNLFAVVLAVVVGLVGARRLGASPSTVVFASLLPIAAVLPAVAVRPQTLVLVLFAGFVLLCALESRQPSRRILFAVPALLLWANLHGSVLLGAAALALLGLTELLRLVRGRTGDRGRFARAVALVVAPWAALCATPYGIDTVHYYLAVLGRRDFGSLVTEWQPATLAASPAFFALALGAGCLIALRHRMLTPWERLAFLVLLIAALAAVRNIVWFALFCLVCLPPLMGSLAQAAPGRRRHVRINLALAGAALLSATAVVADAARRDPKVYAPSLTDPAARAAATAAARGDGLVLAGPRLADWLIWREPDLRGRVAFDIRFELLSAEQLRSVRDLYQVRGTDWRRALRGVDLVLLRRAGEGDLEAALRADGYRPVYRDSSLVLLRRPS